MTPLNPASFSQWTAWQPSLHRREERPADGLQTLKTYRLGNGRWRTFPFWYTLLALSEIDLPAAAAERQYAAPVCERHLRRKPGRDKYVQRRWQLARRILGLPNR